MMLLVFLGGCLLVEGIGIVSACPKVLNNFKTDIFEVDSLIGITSIPFPTYQVLAFAGMRCSTKLEYSFDFPSAFRYFAKLFLVAAWEVGSIVFNARFDFADVEGIVDEREWNVH